MPLINLRMISGRGSIWHRCMRVFSVRARARGMEAIFLAGFQEFLRLRSQPTVDPESVVSGAQRAMRATGSRELDELDMYLPLLATAGPTSPYIGLFGTVWGIMNAFIALGATQQATLAQGGAGHCRGPDCYGDGPVCGGDSSGDCL